MAHLPELQSQVRALSWQLSSGVISWADYREQRRAAIEAIIAGEQEIRYEKPEVKDSPTTPNKHHDTEQVYIDLEEIEGHHNRAPAYLSLAVLAALLVVLGTLLYQNNQLSQARDNREATVAAQVVERPPGEALVHGFRDAGNWSPSALQEFVEAWDALPEAERADAKGTISWRRLQTDLRSRINDQQVLSSVDETGDAQRNYEALVAFREALTD